VINISLALLADPKTQKLIGNVTKDSLPLIVGPLVAWGISTLQWNLEKFKWVRVTSGYKTWRVWVNDPQTFIGGSPWSGTGEVQKEGHWEIRSAPIYVWRLIYKPERDADIGTEEQDKGIVPPLLHIASWATKEGAETAENANDIINNGLKFIGGLIPK